MVVNQLCDSCLSAVQIVNAQLGGEFGSALAAGAYSGSEPTMRLLLECGADVNAQLGGKYGSALVVGVLGGTLSTRPTSAGERSRYQRTAQWFLRERLGGCGGCGKEAGEKTDH